MQEDFYKYYLGLIRGESADKPEKKKQKLILTIKNYNIANGFSKDIGDNEQMSLKIKGPMGKGLMLQSEGTHIAFAAGTGVLVYVDLVALLLKKAQGQQEETATGFSLNEKGFKFIFYASFATPEDAVALELLEGFHKYCQDKNLPFFELRLRLSKN